MASRLPMHLHDGALSMTTTASISVELELTVSGRVTPGQPTRMPNASDDVGEPGYDPFVEDLEISDVRYSRLVYNTSTFSRQWMDHPILTGVDTTGPDVQRLLTNLLELVRDEAEQAVMEND